VALQDVAQGDLLAVRRDDRLRQVEVGAAGLGVAIERHVLELQLGARRHQPLVERLVGVLLRSVAVLLEKSETDHLARVRQIGEDAEALPGIQMKDRAQQAQQVEGRKRVAVDDHLAIRSLLDHDFLTKAWMCARPSWPDRAWCAMKKGR
jgi:hypothetical protein